LQKPFFSTTYRAARNYGAIGKKFWKSPLYSDFV
jgi:hypothetical protein